MSSPNPSESAIFQIARKIAEADARRDYLDQVCGSDAALRERVEALLGAHENCSDFLNSKSVDRRQQVSTEQLALGSESVGQQIGPYKLMEEIGEGGFGRVFVAEQHKPMRRKVALKIIKPGMDSREIIARFEAERQALALMDHPHIARVLDAGTTQAGRPYFAMELVKGLPIVKYCDQQQLSNRDRLELFVAVCQAVQHAHSKGVIHRDLKPSNVMVAPHDGKPVVKVIDFGIAKAIGQQLTDKTVYTGLHQMIGSPLYMSPEQAEINALDVDTRSDIYSLGVLLYELLTGTTPFDRDRFATAAYDEIRRIIREEEPPKPSTRLSSLGDTLSTISSKRNTEPHKLTAQVSGDLDWIVMKCLEKDRSRRYETANSLAADVGRYLGQEPIEARPPSTMYKVQKFGKRNKALLATGGVVASVLVIATVVSTWFGVSAIQERNTAKKSERIAIKAQQEQSRALESEQRQTYNLTMGHAFRAFADGDLDRLESLLDRAVLAGPSNVKETFEFRLLQQQLLSHQPVIQEQHDLQASCSSFSSNGDFLIVGTKSDKVIIYEVTTWNRERIVSLKFENGVRWKETSSVRVLPHSQKVVIGGVLANGVGAWTIVNVATGESGVVHEVDRPVSDVDVSASGIILVATQGGQLSAWQDESQLWKRELDYGERPQLDDAETSDYPLFICSIGDLVAAVLNEDYQVSFISTDDGQLVNDLLVEHCVRAIQFSDDGKHLAVSTRLGVDIAQQGTDGHWSIDQRIHERLHHVAFAPGSDELAGADAFGGVAICDLFTLDKIEGFVHKTGINTVVAISYSPDGRYLTTVDAYGAIKVWDLQKARTPLVRCGHHGNSFHFVETCSTDLLLAIWDVHRDGVRTWNIESGELRQIGRHPGILGMTFSLDGTLLATGGDDGWIRIWEVDSPGAPMREYDAGMEQTWGVQFSPSGRFLAYSGRSGVYLWDLHNGRHTQLPHCPPETAFITLAFSSDGRYLVAGGGKWQFHTSEDVGLTLCWDLEQLESSPTMTPHHRITYAVGFHPNGRKFAAAGMDATLKVYDLATRTSQQVKEKSWWITGLAYSPDGNRIVTASAGQLTFWDAATLEEIGTLRVGDQVRRIAFLHDGTGLVTASAEGYVRVYRALPPVRN